MTEARAPTFNRPSAPPDPAATSASSGFRTACNCPAGTCSTKRFTYSAVPPRLRRFLPELIDLVWNGKINPGKVFDLTLPLDQVAEGYRAIKTLLRP